IQTILVTVPHVYRRVGNGRAAIAHVDQLEDEFQPDAGFALGDVLSHHRAVGEDRQQRIRTFGFLRDQRTTARSSSVRRSAVVRRRSGGGVGRSGAAPEEAKCAERQQRLPAVEWGCMEVGKSNRHFVGVLGAMYSSEYRDATCEPAGLLPCLNKMGRFVS